MAKMTDDRLKAIIASNIDSALGYVGGEVSAERKKALEYYYGQPFGNEIEGRSDYVSRDALDVVEWIMPALMEVFQGSDEVVKFEPQGPEDEQVAEQATEYVNWIINRDNPGFLIFHNWFKDALIEKNGIVKVYWQEEDSHKTESYQGLSEDQMAMLLHDPDVEPVEHDEEMQVQVGPNGEQIEQVTHSLKIRRTEKKGRIKIDAVPPEEFLISRRAVTIEDAPFVAHRCQYTRSELIEMGFDRKDVMNLSVSSVQEYNQERIERFSDDESMPYEIAQNDPMSEHVWITECYLKTDYDGDGYAELRRIVVGSDEPYVILENDEADVIPFCSLTPLPMPHKFFGQSVVDLVQDLQMLKSELIRQMIDNLRLTNNPEKEVVWQNVNPDDLLISRPGGIKRVKQLNSIREITVPFTANASFPMLEYFDSARENRTGVTKYNQGTDQPQQSQIGSQGIGQIMDASQQRIELIARIFAETGVKELFRKILKLVGQYQEKSRMVRLRNQWTPMDPSEWANEFDVTIHVGLGTGHKDKMLAHITQIMGVQKEIIQAQGGLDGPMVTWHTVHNTLEKMVKNAGFKNTDEFFNDPGQNYHSPPQQNPDVEKAKAEAQKHQMNAQVDLQKKEMELAYKREYDNAQRQFEQWKEEYQASTQIAVAEISAGTKLAVGAQAAEQAQAEADALNTGQITESEGTAGQPDMGGSVQEPQE